MSKAAAGKPLTAGASPCGARLFRALIEVMQKIRNRHHRQHAGDHSRRSRARNEPDRERRGDPRARAEGAGGDDEQEALRVPSETLPPLQLLHDIDGRDERLSDIVGVHEARRRSSTRAPPSASRPPASSGRRAGAGAARACAASRRCRRLAQERLGDAGVQSQGDGGHLVRRAERPRAYQHRHLPRPFYWIVLLAVETSNGHAGSAPARRRPQGTSVANAGVVPTSTRGAACIVVTVWRRGAHDALAAVAMGWSITWRSDW